MQSTRKNLNGAFNGDTITHFCVGESTFETSDADTVYSYCQLALSTTYRIHQIKDRTYAGVLCDPKSIKLNDGLVDIIDGSVLVARTLFYNDQDLMMDLILYMRMKEPLL